MRRLSLMVALATGLAVSAASAETYTSLGVSLNIGNAPPPPVVVIREEPRVLVVPGSTVYVVDDRRIDYDFFRYGVYWYVFNDGYWYRARSYRGPFSVIAVKYVPRSIINVPAKHWKHHPHGGPPGQMKKVAQGRSNGVVATQAPSGKGNGNGKGKNKH